LEVMSDRQKTVDLCLPSGRLRWETIFYKNPHTMKQRRFSCDQLKENSVLFDGGKIEVYCYVPILIEINSIDRKRR